MNKHILVVTQYFYPENFRINDICNEWIKKGYRVTVITGIPNYPSGKFYKGYGILKKKKEKINGVDVIRLPIIARGNNKLSLILNYISFIISGWFWKVFTRIKADIIFNFEVSPMTQALPAMWYAKKHKIPFYIYVQDLWPENLIIVGGITNRFIINTIDNMVDKIYGHASKVLVTSNSFKNVILNRGVNQDKVIYWPQYAEDYYIPLKKEIKDGVFRIMYTGNIGEAQGLSILPKLSKQIADNINDVKVKFILIGDGRYRSRLENMIYEHNVQQMFEFLGQKDPKEISHYLRNADVAFISFKDNELFNMTIPAKLQSYLACGKPIYAIAGGETREIINNSRAGLCSKPSDINEAYSNLLKFIEMDESELAKMANNALDYSKQKFNKKELLKQFDELISEEKLHV